MKSKGKFLTWQTASFPSDYLLPDFSEEVWCWSILFQFWFWFFFNSSCFHFLLKLVKSTRHSSICLSIYQSIYINLFLCKIRISYLWTYRGVDFTTALSLDWSLFHYIYIYIYIYIYNSRSARARWDTRSV